MESDKGLARAWEHGEHQRGGGFSLAGLLGTISSRENEVGSMAEAELLRTRRVHFHHFG